MEVPTVKTGWGYPLHLGRELGSVEVLCDEDGYPLSEKDMEPVDVLWDGDGVPAHTPWTDRHSEV